MDVTCPHCGAAYRIPTQLLLAGRKLRCAACKQDWVPEPPAEDEPAPPEAAPPPAAPADGPATAPPPPPAPPRQSEPVPPPLMPVPDPRRIRQARESGRGAMDRTLLLAAWVASVAAVGALATALVLYADAVAAAWPPFARVAQLLGG